ncbi:Brain and acute leukemia cytoplasmic protein [Galemys pyrenaicus]|uniref:Brain and acute leukemia cytoplasmic protein n=1 Tax=Galemys pyrenaicus TaxID=202257 RepID=A0A8J6AN93_GALPY|nr:Brain and acute leukemia cytoplasmic protein [Galemys pyrenaicus]
MLPSPGVLEDGVSSNGVARSTVPGGIANPEKKMSCGTQFPNPQGLSSGPLTQKQNGLRTTEAKRDVKRMSAKEVTINVKDSIRQVDRSRRITKNCVN